MQKILAKELGRDNIHYEEILVRECIFGYQ